MKGIGVVDEEVGGIWGLGWGTMVIPAPCYLRCWGVPVAPRDGNNPFLPALVRSSEMKYLKP